MITILKAPPYLTVQDSGRNRLRNAGVPRGGAMDSFTHQALNTLVGNGLDAAVLEWALAGGSLRFDGDIAFAIGGAAATCNLSGSLVPPFITMQARAGDVLETTALTAGRFLYVAFNGGIDVPVVLGSRATYLPGRFGGLEGRMVRAGDTLRLGADSGRPPAEGFHLPADLVPSHRTGVVRITKGPQADLFDDDAWATLLDSEYKVSTASDRTGYRLDGPALINPPATLPSEAGCPGAIQIPGDGHPIALMADAPTVGGYPKIAVISEADRPVLAQRAPGETVRFELVSIEQSQRALRKRTADIQTIRQLADSSARNRI